MGFEHFSLIVGSIVAIMSYWLIRRASNRLVGNELDQIFKIESRLRENCRTLNRILAEEQKKHT